MFWPPREERAFFVFFPEIRPSTTFLDELPRGGTARNPLLPTLDGMGLKERSSNEALPSRSRAIKGKRAKRKSRSKLRDFFSIQGNAMKKTREAPPAILAAIGALLALGVFAMDLSLELGMAVGILYIALVPLGLWHPQKRFILLAAAAGTVLTILGFSLSPTGGEPWKVLFNRSLSLFAIWTTAILCLVHKRKEEMFRETHDQLENRLAERAAELSKTNEALQKEIAERRRAQEQIKASLDEKELLLKEVNHRAKNNFQLISSLLRIQSREIEDDRYSEIFNELSNRIQSIALIHQRIYQSPDLKKIDSHEYVASLANGLLRAYGCEKGQIHLNIETRGVPLNINTGIPCGLIINELVSNALKHAFPKGATGTIKISLRPMADNKIELIVRDNGTGFPADLDFRDSPSLGLQLVTTLAENQLQGTIELNRNPGTEFKIVFDKDHS